MEVKIEMDSTQLQLLDTNLKEFILSLNDEQKTKLVQDYMFSKFDDLFYEKVSYSSDKRLSNFGQSVVKGLQEKINESVLDKIMENPEIQNILDTSINEVEKNMKDIISNAISEYVLKNLFTRPDEIRAQVFYETKHMIDEERHRNIGRFS